MPSRKATQPISAVIDSTLSLALHPALIINPEAERGDVLAWVFAELENLAAFMDIMACSASDVPKDPTEFARLVRSRVVPLLNGLQCLVDGQKGGL